MADVQTAQTEAAKTNVQAAEAIVDAEVVKHGGAALPRNAAAAETDKADNDKVDKAEPEATTSATTSAAAGAAATTATGTSTDQSADKPPAAKAASDTASTTKDQAPAQVASNGPASAEGSAGTHASNNAESKAGQPDAGDTPTTSDSNGSPEGTRNGDDANAVASSDAGSDAKVSDNAAASSAKGVQTAEDSTDTATKDGTQASAAVAPLADTATGKQADKSPSATAMPEAADTSAGQNLAAPDTPVSGENSPDAAAVDSDRLEASQPNTDDTLIADKAEELPEAMTSGDKTNTVVDGDATPESKEADFSTKDAQATEDPADGIQDAEPHQTDPSSGQKAKTAIAQPASLEPRAQVDVPEQDLPADKTAVTPASVAGSAQQIQDKGADPAAQKLEGDEKSEAVPDRVLDAQEPESTEAMASAGQLVRQHGKIPAVVKPAATPASPVPSNISGGSTAETETDGLLGSDKAETNNVADSVRPPVEPKKLSSASAPAGQTGQSTLPMTDSSSRTEADALSVRSSAEPAANSKHDAVPSTGSDTDATARQAFSDLSDIDPAFPSS